MRGMFRFAAAPVRWRRWSDGEGEGRAGLDALKRWMMRWLGAM